MCAENISEKIADFIEQLSFKDLSSGTIETTKKCILDALGNAYLGFPSPWASAVIELIKEEQGRAESTVINYERKVASSNAALANGTMMHSADFDDVNEVGGHPGAIVVSTALSIGEKIGVNGCEFISSIVIGYEIMDRLIRAVDPQPEKDHNSRGFHPTATCGTFAATAVAGKLLKLTNKQIQNALGIAGSYTAGSMECYNDGSMTKCFHTGKAAHDGITSAILAQKGLTGPKKIFEGSHGFLRAYSDITEPKKITYRLGQKPFKIEKTTFKLQAGCLYTHSALDGILNIINEENLENKDIENISIRLKTSHYNLCADPLPRKYSPINILDAQVSLPFLSALVMTYNRPVEPNDFNEKNIRDQKLLKLARRVKPILDPELDKKEWEDKQPAIVKVTTSDGRKNKKIISYPRGDPRSPLTKKQIEEKFLRLTSPVIGNKKAMKINNVIKKIEKVTEITELSNLLLTST
jgi:2-methylcitrate dehydratase PrpD